MPIPLLSGFDESQGYGLGNSGFVVGSSLKYSQISAPQIRPIRWSPATGQLVDLGHFPGNYDRFVTGNDVNDSGQVAGTGTQTSGSSVAHGFYWDEQTGYADIGVLLGASANISHAYGINNAGVVVGKSATAAGNEHAVYWNLAEGLKELGGFPAGYSHASSIAMGINDQGQITGSMCCVPGRQAFLWDPVAMQMVALSTTTAQSEGFDINNAGQIVGSKRDINSSYETAFFWDPVSGMTDIGALPGHSSSVATALSDDGVVVGYSKLTCCSVATAFVWDAERGIRDLNALIHPDDPIFQTVHLDQANGVNASGQILAGAYLLVKTPRPVHVALGDSYSSGEGAGEYGDLSDVNSICHRSQNVWSGPEPGGESSESALPSGAIHYNLACTGAKTEHLENSYPISDEFSGSLLYSLIPPQLSDSVISSANVVTVTMGGNDVLFGKVMRECALSLDCENEVPDGESESLGTQVDRALERLESHLGNDFSTIKLAASKPGSKVLAFNYPEIFPDSSLLCSLTVFFQEEEKQWINSLANRLSDVIKCSAASAGVNFVDVRDEFEQIHVCEDTSGIIGVDSYYTSKDPFHPNKLGQLAYASALRGGLEHPDVPEICASKITEKESIDTTGTLHYVTSNLVVSPAEQSCSSSFVPGQSLTVFGQGFAGSANVSLYASGENYSVHLGDFIADGSGELSEPVVLPATAPSSGLGFIKALGSTATGDALSLYGSFNFAPAGDSDGDGVSDRCDTCPSEPDIDQLDSDGDSVGDACDSCPLDPENDLDGDGICADVDSCPFDIDNDSDGDGLCASYPGNDMCLNNPNADCLFEAGFEASP